MMQYLEIKSFNLHPIGTMCSFLLLALLVGVSPLNAKRSTQNSVKKMELATFAGGCFWCTEAVYESMDGVNKVTSGYMGGHKENPTYEEVSTGSTGHAEVVQLEFDPAIVSFKELMDVFWQAHDPTTLNRQGADVGTMYRSAIFFHSETQREVAEASKSEVQSTFKNPIVTEITEAVPFFVAEDYHQDFYNNNKTYPYCRVVISPKLRKLGIK